MKIWEFIATIVVTLAASSGFWAYVTFRSERRAAATDQQSADRQLLLGLAHDRIISLGMIYIERGSITKDEYENLYDYLWKPYHKGGGNGSAERVMQEVDKLPMRPKGE